MDHAFGSQTVDLRSNPIRIFYNFIYLFTLFLVFTYLYVVPLDIVSKHGILFTNFARVEFECMFSFVSLLFIFNFIFFLEPKKYI